MTRPPVDSRIDESRSLSPTRKATFRSTQNGLLRDSDVRWHLVEKAIPIMAFSIRCLHRLTTAGQTAQLDPRSHGISGDCLLA
jgi:hypothetical protein